MAGSREYRSKARIYADILRCIVKHGGRVGPTRILYCANLSYDRLTRHLTRLMELGLVEEVKDDDRTLYGITNRGVEFLKEFAKVERFAKAFGITI